LQRLDQLARHLMPELAVVQSHDKAVGDFIKRVAIGDALDPERNYVATLP